MAAAAVMEQQHDETLTHFLTMTDDRVDPDVARNLLEAVGWNVQTAMDQLYGSTSPRAPAATASPAMPDDFLAAAGMSDFVEPGQPQPSLMPTQEASDAELAAAIEASFRSGGQGMMSEEEQMMRALQMSQANEEAQERQRLREQQELELAESILMDQQREQEAARLRAEEEELRRVAEQTRLEEEKRQQQAEEQVEAELQAKRARLPSEPAAGESGRMQLMLRLPNGQRLQRAFRGSDAIAALYDFVDLTCQELQSQQYRLVSNMPRKAYEDRQQSLADAGIQNQFVLMVENVSSA
eukprot:gb/GFBE01034457.1/.p1 GENE.gb/GFBE01034457.1/~~gb/GFBE01034457.1/.p1  ORF type:complete len:297 (+),score=94.30 gb/GFBE01034457.1/:1-891(+)